MLLFVADRLIGKFVCLAGLLLDQVAGLNHLGLEYVAIHRHSPRPHVYSSEIEACNALMTLMFVLLDNYREKSVEPRQG